VIQQVPQAQLQGGVDTSTICSTSSDQDPTLSSAVGKIRDIGTRKRRASVAVWSDPNLLAFAEQKAAEQAQEISDVSSRFAEPMAIEAEVEASDTTSSQSVSLIGVKDDILVHILQFLDFGTIMKFRGVCKRANTLLKGRNSRDLFRNVDLSHWNRKMVDDVFIPISIFLGTRVRNMSLSNCFHLTFKSFKTISNYNTKVTRLDLHSCWELVDSSLALLTSGCPYLNDIDLSNCRKITDRGIYALFSTPRQSYPDNVEISPLMSLDNQSIPSTPSTPSIMAAGISHISLSYCKNLTDTSMRHIAEFGAETLVYINFQRCTSITDSGFEHWQPGSFKCLETVILNDCTFLTDRAIASLVRAAPNIRYISLSFCCALTDNAIELLARQLRYLEHLDVSYCGSAVSDSSVQALVQEGSPNLKEINVRGCVRVTDTAVYALLAIAQQLHLLNISQCQSVTIEARDMLEHYKQKDSAASQVFV
jgi:F-box/leucine-rich repeat protein 7